MPPSFAVTPAPIPQRRRGGGIARFLARLALGRDRKRLADIDPAMLDDIGLSRNEALAESRRPIRDVPQTWQHQARADRTGIAPEKLGN